jgi:hypothetical protein
VAKADPHSINFSQATVSSFAHTHDGGKMSIDDLVHAMKETGFKGDPLMVVNLGTPDSPILVSLDNRRLLAARTAGIDVNVKIIGRDVPITEDQARRFLLNGDGSGDRNFTVRPKTWGEAAEHRIINQGQYDIEWAERHRGVGSRVTPKIDYSKKEEKRLGQIFSVKKK